VTVGITGGHHRATSACFQQDSRYWPATRDVAKDARPFVKRLIEVEKANRGRTIGWCVDEVQRSYTHGGARQGKDYDQWQTEATKTVEAFTGEDPDAARIQDASTYRKSFIFRRGEPGGKRETTWAASGRLAADVNWRRFVDLGVFHYVSGRLPAQSRAAPDPKAHESPGGRAERQRRRLRHRQADGDG
jgi:hypothetical protein